MSDRIKKCTESKFKFRIYSLAELQFYLCYCREKFIENLQKLGDGYTETRNTKIWFRGQARQDYNLLPTAMRSYQGVDKSEFSSFRSYEEYLFEQFKFRADGSQEARSNSKYTISDYIVLMQHYQESSNFLDWTENAFKALFFALERYIKKEKNIIKTDNPFSDDVPKSPNLTLFNPIIYNLLRRDTISHIVYEDNTEKYIKEIILNEINRNLNLIPNMSILKNEELYNMFLLGDDRFDLVKIDNNIDNNLFLPIAISCSRLNARIRTQSGFFVAFNVYTPMTDENFSYFALENIQERFIDKSNFLYQIIIDESCINEIIFWLTKEMGVSFTDVYPDLSKCKEYFHEVGLKQK